MSFKLLALCFTVCSSFAGIISVQYDIAEGITVYLTDKVTLHLDDEVKIPITQDVTVHLTAHDITKLPVDAIVNAANKTLPWPAGGVCRAIYLAAGHEQLNEWMKTHTTPDANKHRLKLGQAMASPSFDLKKSVGIQHIIHTVGPDARINEPVDALFDTYRNSLLVAHTLKAQSIAFPAISIGIFKCDKFDAALNAIAAIAKTAPGTCVRDIYLIIQDEEYRRCIETIFSAASHSLNR